MKHPKVQVMIDILRSVPDDKFRMKEPGRLWALIDDAPAECDWHSCTTPACIGGWAVYHIAMNTDLITFDVFTYLLDKGHLGTKYYDSQKEMHQMDYPHYSEKTHPGLFDPYILPHCCVSSHELQRLEKEKQKFLKQRTEIIEGTRAIHDHKMLRCTGLEIDIALAYLCDIPMHDATRICYPADTCLGIQGSPDPDRPTVEWHDLVYRYATVPMAIEMLEHYRDTGEIKWNLPALLEKYREFNYPTRESNGDA